MGRRVVVRRGVLAWRTVTTRDMSAGRALPQVDPSAAFAKAVGAACGGVRIGYGAGFSEVRARIHDVIRSAPAGSGPVWGAYTVADPAVAVIPLSLVGRGNAAGSRPTAARDAEFRWTALRSPACRPSRGIGRRGRP